MSPVTAVIQKVVVHKGRVYILSGEIYDKVSQAILQGKIEDIDKMLRNIEPTQKLKANPDYYKSDEPLQVDNSTRARNAADWIERELKNKGY